MMKKYFLLIAGVFGCVAAGAQGIDSLKRGVRRSLNEQFPSTRILNVQYEQMGARDFTSKVYDRPFQDSRITSERRFNAAVNLPVYIQPKYIITTSIRYSDDYFESANGHVDFQYFSATGSFTYFSRLFSKPVIYNASLIAAGGDDGFERVYGLVSAALVLKHTPNTTISVGLIGFADPSAFTPVLPSFSLQHTFENSSWNLDFILPQRLLLKKALFGKSQLSLGTEVAVNNFFIRPGERLLTGTYEYTQLEMRTGATFDHHINRNFIVSLRTGYQNVLKGRLIPKNKSYDDDVYRYSPDGASYFNIGISYNPFKKKPVKKPN